MTDPVTLEEPTTQTAPTAHRNLGGRLFHVVIIWFMLSLAATVLTAVTVIQFIIQLASKGQPNDRLAEFGEGLGIWIAKAARYQAAASETKPWPWTDID
jgi:hypothetical protein